MIITCDKCGSKYKISDDLVSKGPKRAKCRNCGNAILIEAPVGGDGTAAAAKAPAQTKVQQSALAADTNSTVVKKQAAAKPAAAAAPAQAEKKQEGGAPGQGSGEGDAANEVLTAREGESPEELAARQQEDIQQKLEKRRLEMEDEISGRLNKAALETLDFDILSELADKLKQIEANADYQAEAETKLFTCIQCKTIFALFPDDSRLCTNCGGEVSLVRGEDILKQIGMFG